MNDMLNLFLPYIRAVIILFLGIPTLWYGSGKISAILQQRVSSHIGVLFSNILFYLGFIILIITVLQQLNFQLTALLGTAGIVGIAVGFAAQTSVSNFISGIFLFLERAFVIGDLIKIDDIMGRIESIDLLSVKMKTMDNKLIRIPNEFFIKKSVTNLSFFSTRRIKYKVQVFQSANVNEVIAILEDVIAKTDGIVHNQKNIIVAESINEDSCEYLLRFWVNRKNIGSVYEGIAKQFIEVQKTKNLFMTLKQEG